MSDLSALQARCAINAAKARAKAIENRLKAPEFAEFVDSLRAKFGDVKVRYVRWPDGTEEGKPGPRGVPVTVTPRIK